MASGSSFSVASAPAATPVPSVAKPKPAAPVPAAAAPTPSQASGFVVQETLVAGKEQNGTAAASPKTEVPTATAIPATTDISSGTSAVQVCTVGGLAVGCLLAVGMMQRLHALMGAQQ